MISLLKKPSALAPLALSLVMLGVIGVFFAMFVTSGSLAPTPGQDEGVGARLFQFWLALEALLIPFFALRWLPQAPKQALVVLTLQVIAVCISVTIVFLLER